MSKSRVLSVELTRKIRWDRKMRPFLLTVFAIFPLHADWIELFDGKSTNGWNPRAEVEQFEAINGELHLLSKTNVWVTSKIEIDDFES